jgi:tripartite-type tricarboxylate transporter receptor subunit TctC
MMVQGAPPGKLELTRVSRGRASTAAAAVALLLIAGAPAMAQSYPERAVRLVVSSAAGGQPDVLARMIAEGMNKKYGKPFVVDNRPGASGILGTEIVKNAKPDGYTLAVPDNAVTAINKSVFTTLPYDIERDFDPVTELVRQPFLFYAHVDLGVNSIKDFVSMLKAKPGQLNFGSVGIGSLHHLCTEMFLYKLGVKATHIPYKGGGDIARALIGGEIQFACSGLSGIQMVDAGKAKVLFVTTAEPTPLVPNSPTLKQEMGIDGFELVARMGVLAPKGTPRAIIEQLSNDIREIYKDQRLRELLAKQFCEVTTEGPEAYAAIIRRETETFKGIVQASGMRKLN